MSGQEPVPEVLEWQAQRYASSFLNAQPATPQPTVQPLSSQPPLLPLQTVQPAGAHVHQSSLSGLPPADPITPHTDGGGTATPHTEDGGTASDGEDGSSSRAPSSGDRTAVAGFARSQQSAFAESQSAGNSPHVASPRRHRTQPSWPQLSTSDTGGEDEDPAELFDLICQLGKGSYGSVFKARERASGQLVAVKVVPLSEGDDPADLAREIELLAACDHPNVVRYLGSWKAPDALWIAMEYCAGGSVSDLMRAADAPLPEELIAFVTRHTLAGLAYLHSVGKVHRDIKCGNILLGADGGVKLADFGVAAQLTGTMSKRNTFIGTPHWMAPEVIQESRYDGKVDMWALGISVIEMAEVVPPRWKVHPMRVIFQISREAPPRLADHARWSPALHDFVARCLQKDPRQRPTAKELASHPLCVSASPSAQAALLPLIAASRDALAEAEPELDEAHLQAAARNAGRPPARRADDTGRFSWKAPPATHANTGTVVPSNFATEASPRAGTPDSRLSNGAAVSSHGDAADVGPDWAGQSGDSGTLVVHAAPPQENAALDTFRVVPGMADTFRELPDTAEPASVGFMGHPALAGEDSSAVAAAEPTDYQAALASAMRDGDSGRASPMDAAMRDLRRKPPPEPSPLDRRRPRPAKAELPPAAAAQQPRQQQNTGGAAWPQLQEGGNELRRQGAEAQPPAGDGRAAVLARLRGLVEGGAVVPLPFLRAADLGQPHALLNDVRAAYMPPDKVHLLGNLPYDAARNVLPGAWRAELARLAAEGADAAATGPGGGASSKSADSASASAAAATGTVAPELLQRAAASAVVVNLLRSLAWHRRMAAEALLPPQEQQRLELVAANLGDTLRTLLLL